MSDIFLKDTNESFIIDVYTIGYENKGESIYFRIKSKEKDFFYDILIDCYKKNRNRTMELLKSQKGEREKLNCICLTHYHEDHFIGLGEILDRYSKKETMVLVPDVDCESSLTEEAIEIRYKIASIVKNGRKKHGTVQKVSDPKQILNQNLYVGDKEYEFEVLAISPLSRVTMRNIGKGRQGIEQNDYSISLLVTLGNLKFLFTGDVMNTTLDNMVEERSMINYLKIPHHGSRDSDKIFRKINMDVNTVCVATNYQSNNLPNIDVLNKYRSITEEVYVIKNGTNDDFGTIHTKYILNIKNDELRYDTECLYNSSKYSKEHIWD